MITFLKNNRKLGSERGLIHVNQLADFTTELKSHMGDQSLSEIYINPSKDDAKFERNVGAESADLYWPSERISAFVAELSWECRIRLDPMRPFAGGVVPGLPWRWHAVIAPMSPGSPMVVLRRQRFDALDLSSFRFENDSPSELIEKMRRGASLVIFGATGSGKTSLMTSLMRHYLIDARLGLAEVIEEIPLFSKRWLRLVEVAPDAGGRGGVSMSRVLAEMMRLSPDVIVIGELRGEEARSFADVARTGHGGVLTTLHAGCFEDAKARLSAMASMEFSLFPRLCGVHVKRTSSEVTVRSEMLN